MKKELVLIVYFFICSFVVIYGIAHMIKLHNTNRYPDGVIAQDSVSFEFENDDIIIDLSFLQKTDADDFTLLQQDSRDPEKYHIIFSKGEYDLFSGDYLSEWDFGTSGNYAVIGEDADSEGKDVLGRISDYDVFARRFAKFFLDYSYEEVFNREVFIIASEIENHASDVFAVLKHEMEQHGLNVREVQSIHVFFGEYDKSETKLLIVVGIFWVIVFVLTFIAALFWFAVKKSMYRVLVMFGAKVPLIKIYLPFFMIASITFFLQWIGYVFLHEHSHYINGVILQYSVIIYASLMMSLIPVSLTKYTENRF